MDKPISTVLTPLRKFWTVSVVRALGGKSPYMTSVGIPSESKTNCMREDLLVQIRPYQVAMEYQF